MKLERLELEGWRNYDRLSVDFHPQRNVICGENAHQIIRDALVQGDSVQIRGFGTFGVKIHKGRNSLDISTGEKRVSNDCRVPMFKASDSLKGAVRASESADE